MTVPFPVTMKQSLVLMKGNVTVCVYHKELIVTGKGTVMVRIPI